MSWQHNHGTQRAAVPSSSQGDCATEPTGSGGGTRTHNLAVNSRSLCQLSYPGLLERLETKQGYRCRAVAQRTRPLRYSMSQGTTAASASARVRGLIT